MFAAIGFSIAASACSGDPLVAPDAYPGAFTVDSASYTAQPIWTEQVGFKVVARYHNPTSAPIYLERCGPTSPHPLFSVNLASSSFTTESGYNIGYACVGHDNPIVVAAGDTRVDTLRISGPNAYDNTSHQYLGAVQGRFSLTYRASACRPADPACDVTAVRVPTTTAAFDVKLTTAGLIPAITRDLAPAIQTDSLIYHVQTKTLYEASIGLTWFNPTADTSYIVNCNGETGVSMEKQIAGAWQRVWSPPIPACLSQPIVIPPGAHYEQRLRFEAVPSWMMNSEPRFTDPEIAGTYRLVFTDVVNHYRTPPNPFGPTIPFDYRRSNAFVLVAEF